MKTDFSRCSNCKTYHILSVLAHRLFTLFQTAKRMVSYRRLLLSIGRASPTATPIFEDNAATIAQVLRDRITPRTKHLDILITWLHEQYSQERFVPIHATSHN